MQTEQTDFDLALSDDVVLGYLKSNPDFFVKNGDILPKLRIPHETGPAVSLIEKQVSVLRNKCGHLENSLCDFIAVARENENLNKRLHSLVQDLISAPSLEAIIKLTRTSLKENFNADDVHIMLISPEAESSCKSQALEVEGLKTIDHKDKQLELFKELLESNQTVCGMPDKCQLDFLIGEDHSKVASAALIPLQHERKIGVVMLTSCDEARFAASKGVVFLNQLGDLLGRRLHSYDANEAVIAE